MWKIHARSFVRIPKSTARKICEVAPQEVFIYSERYNCPLDSSTGNMKYQIKRSHKGTFDDACEVYFKYTIRGVHGGRYPAFAVSLAWWEENYLRFAPQRDPKTLVQKD